MIWKWMVKDELKWDPKHGDDFYMSHSQISGFVRVMKGKPYAEICAGSGWSGTETFWKKKAFSNKSLYT